MFEARDVAEYYNTTQIHYEQWWSLKKHLSLHYGIWDGQTKTFAEAISNTNKIMLETAGISDQDKVLDAGCGVGGAAFFVNRSTKSHVTGISLSTKQIAFAKEMSVEKGVSEKVKFHVMDFTDTIFAPESFDVIWACESVCQATDKQDFLTETFRLLKKGGRLILCDFFIRDENQEDKHRWIHKWESTWAVREFVSLDYFTQHLEKVGFNNTQTWDYTDQVKRSARRMYYTSFLGAVPSELYNLINPKVSRFARTHYKCGYYQYRALKEDLWRYNMILAEKK